MWVRLGGEAVCWGGGAEPAGLGTRSIADTVGKENSQQRPGADSPAERGRWISGKIRWEEESEVNKLRDGIDRGYRWENKLLREIECRLA